MATSDNLLKQEECKRRLFDTLANLGADAFMTHLSELLITQAQEIHRLRQEVEQNRKKNAEVLTMLSKQWGPFDGESLS